MNVGDKVVVGGRVVEILQVHPYQPREYGVYDRWMNDPRWWPMFTTTFYKGSVGIDAIEGRVHA